MTWFAIPEGYSCVTRQNDTTLYGYVGSRRDTFTLNGLNWQKTATQSNVSYPSNQVCVTTPQTPSSFLMGAIVAGTLIVLGAFSIIVKMIRSLYL